MHQLPNHPDISTRLAALVAALLEHLLALFSLASWETSQGAKKILFCLLLAVVILFLGFVGYLLLLALLLVAATSLWQLNLLLTLSLLALGHFALVGALVFFIYRKRPTSFFILTSSELLRDIEIMTSKNHL